MKKAVLTIIVSFTAIAGIVTWILFPDKEVDLGEIVTAVVAAVVILFGLFIGIRRIKDVRKNLPVEDERSKKIMKNAGATSFYLSLYLWLALMFFEEGINLEKHSLIGLGILGMAIIFALSWIYHNYFSIKND